MADRSGQQEMIQLLTVLVAQGTSLARPHPIPQPPEEESQDQDINRPIESNPAVKMWEGEEYLEGGDLEDLDLEREEDPPLTSPEPLNEGDREDTESTLSPDSLEGDGEDIESDNSGPPPIDSLESSPPPTNDDSSGSI